MHGNATTPNLPLGDMRRQGSAERVLKEVREQVAEIVDVVLWMALPCTAWSRWQQVNMQTGKHSAELIMVARGESKACCRRRAAEGVLGAAPGAWTCTARPRTGARRL